MPIILVSIAHALGGVLINLILKVFENPVFIQKVLIMTAEKAVKMTATDLDDKMLDAAKQILEAGAPKDDAANS